MSRQPPPPGVSSRGAGQSYRPSHDNYYDRANNSNTYRPRNENIPPPSYNSPPRNMYQFQGNNRSRPGYDHGYDQRGPPRYDNYDRSYDSYAPGTEPHRNSDSYRPRDEGFIFRQEPPPNINFNQSRDTNYRRRSRSPQRQPYREANGYNPGNRERDRRNLGPQRTQRGGRGGYPSRKAADRAFLKTNRAPTPELMPGMDEDAGIIRYKAVDEMSDSDEAEMDVSDDDENEEDQQPRKKQARAENKAADGDSVPKWSNPDPYTALPPPDESQRKKKDVVKLIRKARVTAATENAVKAATTDDFISFDDLGDDQEMTNGFNPVDEVGYGVPGAPTGPRGQQVQVPNNFRENGHSQNHVKEPAKTNGHGPNTSKIQIELPNRPPAKLPKKPAAVIDLTSDPSLGNRKRNIRDEIKGPPMIHGPSGPKGQSDGKIVASWRAKAGRPSTPWIEMDHSQTSNMGIWLHKEIIDFYYYVKPREFEQRIRQNLIDDLRVQVKKHFSDCDIRSFGSFPAGLYLPTADMDIVCVSNEFLHRGKKVICQSKNQMYRLGRFLENREVAMPGTVEVVGGAKVPIIKYVDKLTGLRVDISFENDTGLIANETFQDWKTEFPAMPILVTLIKHLLAMRGLNEPVNGGIGGFSTICLVVSLLQNMPQVQSRNMIPEHNLGETLMEFFDLYGNQFNTSTTAISMKPPGYLPKNRVVGVTYKGRTDKISIIDPNNSTNDISAGSQNTPRILECFSNAFRDLQKRMGELQASPHRAKESILSCILGGNYSSFDLQRQHLAHVHEKLVGPIRESV